MPAPTAQQAVLAQLRHACRDGTSGPGSTGALERFGLRALTGGRNNTVYTWTPSPGAATICIKLYTQTDKRRLDREWSALALVNDARPDDAPTPLWRDLDAQPSAVGMAFLPGTPLPELDPTERQPALKALAAVHSRLQDLPLRSPLRELERIDSWTHYTHRLTHIWPDQLAQAPNDPLSAQMFDLLDRWHHYGDNETPNKSVDPPVFSRGDSNLLNWLWDGSRIRCVDFEFAGHSDTAFDAADLIEHISTRTIDDDQWHALLPDLGVTKELHTRFRSAQRTCALRWLAVLWKRRATRAKDFSSQLDRVNALFSGTPLSRLSIERGL